ncbi:unnamed protein product [Brassica oleracea]
MLRLVLQVISLFFCWRERNYRRHNGTVKPGDHFAN